VNIYVLDDGDGWCAIDTGYHSKRGVRLWEKILSGPLAGKPVTRVLVTHHHPDHVGMAGWLQNQQGAELLTSRTAWLYARMLTLDEQEVWPDETVSFYRAGGMPKDMLDRRLASRPRNFADMVHPMPLGFRRLRDGDTVRIGHRTWDIRRGDGHAPEHLTLWSRDDAVVISGDQILPGISSNIGVYPTEPEADPMADWLASCDRLAEFATNDQLVLPGHKLPFYGLPARIAQLAQNQRAGLDRLVEFLETPKTAVDCFPLLFKRKIVDDNFGMAMVESIAHLNHLHIADKLTRETTQDGVALWRRKQR
jgi:glyoxylase-like metal-dependent hydrolase (beta-lactamase superfamily II)